MQYPAANWNTMEWEVVRPGIKRKIYTGDGATLSLNHLDPGHEPKPHVHKHEQLVYILEGECDFYVSGKAATLKAGGLLHIPPNVEHYIVVTGKTPVINLDVFAPKREDYIK